MTQPSPPTNQTQPQEPIFDTNNKKIRTQWQKINHNKQIKVISAQQLTQFIKNVFQATKDQLQMQIDDETDYQGMVDEYLEECVQRRKKLFSYEQAVKVLNWAVQPEYQEQQNHQGNFDIKKQEEQRHSKSSTNVVQNKENHQKNKSKLQISNVNQLNDKKLTRIQNHQNNDNQTANHHQQTSHNNNSRQQQKQISIKQIIGYQQQSQHRQIHHPLIQNSQHNQNYLDWGEVYDQDKQKIKLYKSINSFHPTSQRIQIYQNQNDQRQQIVTYPKLKKPVSIKKSLAKINKNKSLKPHINQQKLLNLVLNDPKSPQIKYIKKQKIIFKSKKPKPQFKPQIMGLKQLFKFYCALHSQHSSKKPKDSIKGTFQHIKSNISQLYMHNFMLLCKDFSIMQSKRFQNGIRINVSTVNESEDNQRSQQNEKDNNKQSIKQNQDPSLKKARVQKNIKRRRNNLDENSDIWDRDRLCAYFKRQADYKLNVKYDLFVEIMKQVLRNRITVQTQAQEIFDQGGGNDYEQQNNELSHRIDPYVLGICKFFKVDTEQNFKQTMNRVKIIYKMLDPESLTSKNQQKKLNGELNGHFKQHIHQNLKVRQLQKQKQRVQVKQKYFNKYSSTNNDIYSSFRVVKNQKNSSNGVYCSAPKLSTQNLYNSTQPNTKRLVSINKDSDLSQLRKNISKNYNSTSNICSILKQARREINQQKQNPSLLNSKQQTLRLPKSRFNPFQIQKQKSKVRQKIFHQLKQTNQQDKTITSILGNKSRLMEQNQTQRTRKIKNKSKDINSPLLKRFGCHQQDELLDKYFDQEKLLHKPQQNHIH